MANTYTIYTGDGTQTDFAVPFEYLDDSFVHVSVDGADVPFTFKSAYIITCDTAPAAGSKVRVGRQTTRDELIDEIPSSGIITGNDINIQSKQALDVSEEAFDALTTALSENSSGDLDAESRRIINVRAPASGTDATNRDYVDSRFTDDKDEISSLVGEAQTAAQDADQSATEARGAAHDAKSAQTSAETARDQAQGYRLAAGNAAGVADASASEAKQYRDEIYNNPSAIRDALELGTAAQSNSDDFATSEQGDKADNALLKATFGDTETSGTFVVAYEQGKILN